MAFTAGFLSGAAVMFVMCFAWAYRAMNPLQVQDSSNGHEITSVG